MQIARVWTEEDERYYERQLQIEIESIRLEPVINYFGWLQNRNNSIIEVVNPEDVAYYQAYGLLIAKYLNALRWVYELQQKA